MEMIMVDDVRGRGGRPRLDKAQGEKGARPSANSLFGHAVAVTGLSHQEAADFLDLSLDTIRSYASGRRKASADVMDRIAGLWEQVSYRIDPSADLPEAARLRREALQDLRTRTWKVKDRSDA